MLTGIGLRNFKAFGDEMQEVPLSKITLIYGPNSGGKSSIIQALLLLRQSLRNNYPDARRAIAPRGEFVDLGSFQFLLHKHDPDRTVSISVRYKNNDHSGGEVANDVDMTFAVTQDSGSLTEVVYRILYQNQLLLHSEMRPNASRYIHRLEENEPSWDDGWFSIANVCDNRDLDWRHVLYPSLEQSFLPRLTLPELRARRQNLLEDSSFQPDMSRLRQALNWANRVNSIVEEKLRDYVEVPYLSELIEDVDRERLAAELGLLPDDWDELDPDSRDMGLSDIGFGYIDAGIRSFAAELLEQQAQEDVSDLDSAQIVALTPETIPNDYERTLRLINYLGPLRSPPQRIYTLLNMSENVAGITGVQGEFTPSVLHRDSAVVKQVNEWFERFGVDYSLEVITLSDAILHGEYITIGLTDTRTRAGVTLSDVGFGISCILPVMVEGIASHEASIICVEQPEIHLHPRLQANIADLMIDTIADEPGKRKQWIVETHSELLITRLQRRIREGKIKVEDISVLYVDPDDEQTEGSAIIPLRMDENGEFIDHWPHGFFDEAFNELMAEPDSQLHPADR